MLVEVDENRIQTLLSRSDSNLYRSDVTYLVESGVWTPSEAENWAKKTQNRPFAIGVNIDEFDPIGERYWSITMTVSWIMGRNPDAVRSCWKRYLELCYEWLPHPPNPDAVNRYPHALVHPQPNVANAYALNRVMTINRALTSLRVRLESGSISATGLARDGVRRPISKLEWCDLSFIVKDYDGRLTATDDATKLTSNKELYLGFRETNDEYTRVLIDTPQIFTEFPALDNSNHGVRGLGLTEVRGILRDEITRRNGFIDQASAAEFIRLVDPSFKRDSVRAIVRSLTGNTKRGPRGKRRKSAPDFGENSPPA
jgi:hypothetical protein